MCLFCNLQQRGTTYTISSIARKCCRSLSVFPFVRLSCFYESTKAWLTTGGPSSSCEMIILHNNSYGGIIRVFINTIRQILNENNSPYFHSVSLVIWPFTLMKRTHFSELSISRFSTYTRKAQGWTLHFRTPDPRSEKSQRKKTGRPQIQRRIQAHIL